MRKKILLSLLSIMLLISCAGCDTDTSNYTGPWWTQLGGNSEHTGTIDTADFDMPDVCWIYEFKGNNIRSRSTPLVVNGYVYFGATDGYVYCIRDKNKKQVWKYKTEGSITNTLIYQDDVIYAASNDGYVYALDAKKGKLIWFHSVGEPINFTPVIANNTIIVGTEDVSGTKGGTICAMSLDNGAEQWKYIAPATISTDLTYYNYSVDGGIVYFACSDHYYYALNAKTGKFIWDFNTAGAMDNKTVVAYNEKVYIATGAGIMYALDAANGKEIWSFRVKNGMYMGGSPAIKDGKIVFGAYDSMVYCLDAETGIEIWEHQNPYWITSAITIVGNSVLYGGPLPTNEYYLYCLNLDTGSNRWTSAALRNIRVAPSVVNGCIYYTEESGRIIKLG